MEQRVVKMIDPIEYILIAFWFFSWLFISILPSFITYIMFMYATILAGFYLKEEPQEAQPQKSTTFKFTIKTGYDGVL